MCFENGKPFRPHLWERETRQRLPRGTTPLSLLAAKYDKPNSPAGEFSGGRDKGVRRVSSLLDWSRRAPCRKLHV